MATVTWIHGCSAKRHVWGAMMLTGKAKKNKTKKTKQQTPKVFDWKNLFKSGIFKSRWSKCPVKSLWAQVENRLDLNFHTSSYIWSHIWLPSTANLLPRVNLLKTAWWKCWRKFVLRSKSLPMLAWLVTLWYGELKTFYLTVRGKRSGLWLFFVNLRRKHGCIWHKSLRSQTRGTDLFVCVCSAVEDMKLPWNKVTGIITGGAPAMAGKQSGLLPLVCNKVSEEGGKAIKLHYIIHHQVLCAKDLKYDHVMKPVLRAINYIRSKALCHRQFQQFLLNIQAEYGDVVYHNDVRWLSLHCNAFTLLGRKSDNCWQKKGQPMPELSDPVWLADFGFLVDMTRHLNVLNTSLQGQNEVVSQLYSHIKAFGTKVLLFQRHLSQTQPNTTHFSSLQEIMTSFPLNNISAQMRRYTVDISSLAEEFQQCFRDFATIEKEITLFPLPSPWTLMTLQSTCSWSSLSCSVTPSVKVSTNSSLLSTFTASWIKAGSKRFEHLLRKCWACLAQHTCARKHSRLWILTRTAWGRD